MRKKRIMIIGPTKCGKTTLANVLNDYTGLAKKTQDIIYGKNTIDVPGAYIENSWMYKHLIAAAQDAAHILILVDASKCTNVYSPGFAKVFRCPVTGVINKVDLADEKDEFCIRQLKQTGVTEPYFRISSLYGTGISALKKYLLDEK